VAKLKGGVIVKGVSRYFRLAQVETLLENSHKANGIVSLGVEHYFEYMCVDIVYHDFNKTKQHALLKPYGLDVNFL
jgi:GDP-D-mannose dehydratase